MSKKSQPKKRMAKAPARKSKPAEARTRGTRTIKPNGALGTVETHTEPVPEPEKVNIGEAMRRAVEELGAVKIDAQLAPNQLAELATCYEDVTRRQAAFSTKSDEAKTAKKALESATELLLEKVRLFTHPKALPLFDAVEAEQDRGDMLDGGDVDDPEEHTSQHADA